MTLKNEKDMADLWDILPIGIIRIRKNETENTFWSELFFQNIPSGFIQINWHDKYKIRGGRDEILYVFITYRVYYLSFDNNADKGDLV